MLNVLFVCTTSVMGKSKKVILSIVMKYSCKEMYHTIIFSGFTNTIFLWQDFMIEGVNFVAEKLGGKNIQMPDDLLIESSWNVNFLFAFDFQVHNELYLDSIFFICFMFESYSSLSLYQKEKPNTNLMYMNCSSY